MLGIVRAPDPSHFIDLLLNLQAFEVVKLWLMGLELCEVSVLKAWASKNGGWLALLHPHIALQANEIMSPNPAKMVH